jgi:hypothetical protein
MSENKDYSATYNMGQEILRLESRIKELEIQLEQAKKDQARYQWIRNPDNMTCESSVCVSDDIFNMYFLDDLDEAIDAAMQEWK